MTLDKAKVWLSRWAEVWNLPDLPPGLRIEASPRLRRSLGRCQPASGLIRLHPALLAVNDGDAAGRHAREALLEEVLCHEVAHVAVHMLHGRSVRPHGPEWARLMRAAGYPPRVKMDPALLPAGFSATFQPRVLYLHRCPVCGASRIAGRAVRRWRCRACHDAGLEERLEISTRQRREAEAR